MADVDFISQLIGPTGALVLSVTALIAVWKQGRADIAAKDKLFAEQLMSKDADILFERSRTAAAEERLDRLGGLLKDATAVMDRSVTLTEKALTRLRSED